MILPGRIKKYLPAVVFLLVAGLMMWDLLGPGYIFTIDASFGPASPQKALWDHLEGISTNLSGRGISPVAGVIYYGLTYLPSLVLPAWVMQKLPLFLLLAAAGWGMYRLAPTKNSYGRYFAGLLYLVNPFLYIRFLTGAFWFLWGYALLPFAVKSFMDLLDKPSLKRTVRAGVWLTLITPSTHILIMALGLLCLLAVYHIFKDKNRRKILGATLGAIALFLILNAGWVYSVSTGEAQVLQNIESLTIKDLEIFAPSGGEHVLFDVASMYGFWRGGYDYPQYHLPGWQILFAFLLLLAVYGFIRGFRGKHGLNVKAMGLLTIVSLVLAAGVSLPYFAGVSYLLYKYVPFYVGFRDSQKFVTLLVMAYAYLGSVGVAWLGGKIAGLHHYGAKLNLAFHLFTLALILTYGYTVFFGFHGYVSNEEYPPDYYEVESLLTQGNDDFNVLFLPWHQAMHFTWATGVINNPADVFFSKPVIRGDNIELLEVYSESTNPVSRYIEAALKDEGKNRNFGELLSPLGIKYVILAKEVDWEGYHFLKEQPDLTIVKDTPHLILFLNRSYHEFPTPAREKAESLGLSGDASEQLENQLMRYGQHTAWWGYLPSGVFLLLGIGYAFRKA